MGGLDFVTHWGRPNSELDLGCKLCHFGEDQHLRVELLSSEKLPSVLSTRLAKNAAL